MNKKNCDFAAVEQASVINQFPRKENLFSPIGQTLTQSLTKRNKALGQSALSREAPYSQVKDAKDSNGKHRETSHRKKILIAETAPASQMLVDALQDRFDLIVCHTFKDACSKLNKQIDAVLCGMHFDGSHMFELLEVLKKSTDTRSIPFISLNTRSNKVARTTVMFVTQAILVMGGNGLIDLSMLREKLGHSEAAKRLRLDIEDMLKVLN